MLGRSHALSGLITGVGIAAAVPHAPLPLRLLVVPVCGGAALVNDLDHVGSKIAHSLGPITKGLCKVVDEISLAVYHATRCEGDPANREGGHRTATHTIPGCLFFGVLVGFATLVHPIAGAVVLSLLWGLLISWVRTLGRRTDRASRGVSKALLPEFMADLLHLLFRNLGMWFALAGGALSWVVMDRYPGWWWLLGVTVFLGSLTHVLGDACTNSGVPLLWPLQRGGKRWGKVRTRSTFKTGSAEETETVTPILVLGFAAATGLATGVLQPIIFAIADRLSQ